MIDNINYFDIIFDKNIKELLMICYINYPAWLTPEVFGLKFLRWYPLMYIVGIVISYLQAQHILKNDNLKTLDRQLVDDWYFWGILSLVLGGRIFSCLVYSFKDYIRKPLEILIPFTNIKFSSAPALIFHLTALILIILLIVLVKLNKLKSKNAWIIIGVFYAVRLLYCLLLNPYYLKNKMEIFLPFKGDFTGYAGMAYHGAVIGIFLASVIYVIIKNIDPRDMSDLAFSIAPLGYTFGRIANFINSELWGRVTAMPFGIYFYNADKVPLNLPNVQAIINKLGWKVDEIAQKVYDSVGNEIVNAVGYIRGTDILGINLPRHPSQLYEAFFEGIVLFVIIWFFARKFKPFKGFIAFVYLVGYAVARFFLEFLRQPDSQFANVETGKYTGYIIGSLSMGQILSILMALFGIGVGVFFYIYSKKKGDLLINKEPEEE